VRACACMMQIIIVLGFHMFYHKYNDCNNHHSSHRRCRCHRHRHYHCLSACSPFRHDSILTDYTHAPVKLIVPTVMVTYMPWRTQKLISKLLHFMAFISTKFTSGLITAEFRYNAYNTTTQSGNWVES